MKLKSGIVAVNTVVGDWADQLVILRRAIEEAKKANIKLLVFPELVLGGPDARDLFLHSQTAYFAEQVLGEIVAQTNGLTVILGTPLLHDGRLYNVAAIFHDGRLMAFVPKRYPETPVEEERWFARWNFEKSEFHIGAPIGSLDTLQTPIPGLENLKIIFGVPALHPAPEKGSIVVELNNRPFAPNLYREELSQRIELSRKFNISLLRANMLGSDDGTHVYDGGGYILSQGSMVALSPRFVFDTDYVLTTSEDKIPSAFDPSLAHFMKLGSSPASGDDYPYAELELALSLALNDYMKRAHVQKLCLALSGGRDSAMIAVIVARMLALKTPDLSVEQRREKMNELLYCAYLPSKISSSAMTQKAALALADFFGFSCPVIPIADLAASTLETIENTMSRRLTWEHDDLTLQNVQARTRSLIIWTLANANHAMLLTTGNMSEAAVGYATMDGDASGCLDPIGNIPKTLVSRWLEWACRFHQIPALEYVFAQPPSAELRPIEKGQSDEADLMPYPVLDAYIEWFLIRRLSPKAVYQLAKSQLAAYYENTDNIASDIKRFIKLAVNSQWKRNRFANSFKVLSFDIAPDSDLRWPCLQDTFTRACDEL